MPSLPNLVAEGIASMVAMRKDVASLEWSQDSFPIDTVFAADAAGLPQSVIQVLALYPETPQDARARLATAKTIHALRRIVKDTSAFEGVDFDAVEAAWVQHGFTEKQYRADLIRIRAEHDEETNTSTIKSASYKAGDHFEARAAHIRAQAEKANHGAK